MAQRIQHRRGTAAQWASANPTLAMGEWGYETDTGRVKIGDASTPWATLPYSVGGRATPTPLLGFLAALAKADESPVTVVVVGDSLSEDWQWVDAGVSESVGLRSWVRLAEEDLAERFHAGVVGVGWLPIRSGLGTNPGWDTVTGSLVTTTGFGRYAVQLDATEYAEHTETCDGVEVFFSSIASTVTVHVDGVLAATLTASAVPTVWDSGALTEAAHTIKVTAVGGQAFPYGSYWHLGTRTSGVRFHNGGHSGYGPDDHLATTGMVDHIALVDPDLVIVPIGAAAGGTVFSGTLADYAENIDDLLTEIQTAAPDAAVVHVAEHAFTGKESTWPAFAAASRALAAAGGYGFADCYEAIGYVGTDPHDLALADGVHLTARGMRLMADTVLAAVVGPITRMAAGAGGGVLSVSGTAPVVSSGGATPAISVTAASTSASGVVELGTDAETQTGTDTARVPSLASAAATFFRKLIPTSTEGTVTHADGGVMRFISFFTTPVIGIRRTGDTADRAQLLESTVGFGPGTGLLDAGISRSAAGVMVPYGSSKFRPGTPSDTLDAADKAYVDGRTPAASTTVSGVVELATTAETQTGTDTARAVTPAAGAATYQPLDTELTALAGLTSAADTGIQFTGAGTAGTFTLTAAGKALLDDADASAQRTTLGLGTAATAGAASDSASGIVELATNTEALAGTDTTRVLTPANGRALALPQTNVTGSFIYFAPAGTRAGGTSLGSAAGVLYAVPLFLPATTYVSIGIYYYGTGTATLRLGLWNCGSDGGPGTVALDAGTVTCTAGDGVVRKEITISHAPAAGWFWAAMLVDAYTSTPDMMAIMFGGMGLLPGHRSGGDTNNAAGLIRTGVTTGALGTWGASGSSVSVASSAPMIYVRT